MRGSSENGTADCARYILAYVTNLFAILHNVNKAPTKVDAVDFLHEIFHGVLLIVPFMCRNKSLVRKLSCSFCSVGVVSGLQFPTGVGDS